MPALHTAFRLVLERQRDEAGPRRAGPGPGETPPSAEGEVDAKQERVSSDGSGHPVSR